MSEQEPGTALAGVSTASQAITRPHMTVGELVRNVALIQQAMETVMKEGHHYGRIPGTPKPTLYQPGAEKLLQLFRLRPEHDIEDQCTEDRRAYRVKVTLTHIPSGEVVADGWGSASTDEERYRWRKAVNQAEWEATPKGNRRIKYRREKVKNKNEYMDKEDQQIRTEPMDLDNTVLKMACKRALIHATRTGTAASDVFAQDLEDLPEHLRAVAQEEPPIQQPQPVGQPPAQAAPQAAQPQGQDAPPPTDTDNPNGGGGQPAADPEHDTLREVGVVERMSAKAGGSADNPWTRYAAKVNGEWYSTFSDSLGTVIQDLKNSGEVAVLIYHMDGDYRNLDDIYPELEDAGAGGDVPWD
jgi:hypothetical protein